MKYTSLLAFTLLLTACHSGEVKNSSTDKGLGDVSGANQTTRQELKNQDKSGLDKKDSDLAIIHHPDSSKMLYGVWTLTDNSNHDNPTFEIRKSTMYYPDLFKSFKYTVKGDSLKIFYPDGPLSFKYSLNKNDTLVLESETFGTTIYHRQKS